MNLSEHIKLALLYSAKPRKQFRLLLLKIFFGYLVHFEPQLQLKQLLFDDRFVVQLLVGELLNLAEYETEPVYREEKQIVYD